MPSRRELAVKLAAGAIDSITRLGEQATRLASRGRDASAPAEGSPLRVAVDLTPFEPGKDGTCAQRWAATLVAHLASTAPTWEFAVLTSEACHDQLAWLERDNLRRLPAVPTLAGFAHVGRGLLETRTWRRLRQSLRPDATETSLDAWRAFLAERDRGALLRRFRADLVFCPLSPPPFHEPTAPVVSLVHDLQHLSYPQFFTAGELRSRERHFRNACRFTAKVICVSENARKAVIQNGPVHPQRVVSIRPRLLHPPRKPDDPTTRRVLLETGLTAGSFVLFPANAWPHKNHAMLFTAYGIFRARHPRSGLRLVCAGAPSQSMQDFREEAGRMGLGDWIVFADALSEESRAGLVKACRAVIIPSLYSGLPLSALEALALGKPVLCSNAGSLAKVSDDAALHFDPRKPLEMVAAFESLETELQPAGRLPGAGQLGSALYGDAGQMCLEYLGVLRQVAASQGFGEPAVHGVHADGWTTGRVTIAYVASKKARRLILTLAVHTSAPFDRVSVRVVTDQSLSGRRLQLPRGEKITVVQRLRKGGGLVEILVDSLFQPKSLGLSEDTRLLGCLLESYRIVAAP